MSIPMIPGDLSNEDHKKKAQGTVLFASFLT